MRLGIDTHHLLLEHAGTKRVTLNLIEQFRKRPGLEVVELRPGYSVNRGKAIVSKLWGHFSRFFWVHVQLPFLCWQKRIDILLSPEFNTPMFTPCPRAVIAHDAHMRAQREYTSALWFYFYYIPFIETAIRRADIVFTVSEFAKKQVAQYMRIPDSKIFVVYNGIDPVFLDRDTPATAVLPERLVPGEYVLFVGTFEARKNIELLLEAFSLVKKRLPRETTKLKLAIVGKPAAGKHSDRSRRIHELINRNGIENDVVVCGFVADQDLPAYYRNCRFLVFPSTQEGFGLPILEAFASDVPVITSNVCSMPEIAGEAALLFDPSDVEALAEAMEAVYFDEGLADRLVALGKKRIALFSWEIAAKRMLSIMKDGGKS